MAVTIKKLAAELGISPATVSLALNGSPLVAAETRARVEDLAARLDYVPNNFGRGLQSRKSHLIGYMLTGITTSFFNEILQGSGFAAAGKDYGLLTGWVSPDKIGQQMKIMLEKNIDGLILSVEPELAAPYIEKLKRRKTPFLFCSTYLGDDYSLVITDNFLGGAMAVGHLLDCGHRTILCCSADPMRLAGNQDAVSRRAGARCVPFARRSEIPGLLKSTGATAITAYSDLHAMNIIFMLRQAGLRVPEDVSVIGFDDLWVAKRPEFELTTISQQKTRLGEEAVNGLLDMISGRRREVRVLLPPELVERKTVAKISSKKNRS